MRPRRSAIIVLLLILIASSLLAAQRPPNFIILFADDQGYNDLGCYGSRLIRTPNIDRMASEGVRFTDFYAQPICGPSRAALMTGCYPLRLAERANHKHVHPVLHPKELTIAELLRPLGYATGMIGKWDLAGHSNRPAPDGEVRYIGQNGRLNPPGYFLDLLPNHQGFDFHYGSPSSNDNPNNTVLLSDGQVIENPFNLSTGTKRYTERALRFIGANKERPFFLYLAYNMPHTALAASDAFRGGNPKRGLYGDVIEELDWSVGEILKKVRAEGLSENTYVVYTSDNGPWVIKNIGHRQGQAPPDHGGSAVPLRSAKVSTWEGGIRVPCIVWGPGRVPAGQTCDAVAATIDILPTFAALAGATMPTDRTIDGQDIRHLIHGQFESADPDRVYYYYLWRHLQAVRQGRWKLHLERPRPIPWLARFSPNRHLAPADDIAIPEPLLYDLEKDISEKTNVAAQHPAIVKRLQALAQKARTEIGDYNHLGSGGRFYDKGPKRPETRQWHRPNK